MMMMISSKVIEKEEERAGNVEEREWYRTNGESMEKEVIPQKRREMSAHKPIFAPWIQNLESAFAVQGTQKVRVVTSVPQELFTHMTRTVHNSMILFLSQRRWDFAQYPMATTGNNAHLR